MGDKEFLETEENIGIIELIDENGEAVQFEHLDTLELDGITYVILTPYTGNEDEEESDVFIMEIVTENGEDILVTVEDGGRIQKVFEEFKARTKDDFDFVN
ncbi:MAG: DUF1292 domain-containing protein [Eubacteriales bacterium]|nr:DUF1292 domain-containing protein [Eubacteriales bacterium]